MNEGNDYGVHHTSMGGAVKGIHSVQFHETDAIGPGMTTTVERKAQLWHSRRALGANTGSAESRSTGIGLNMGRSEG